MAESQATVDPSGITVLLAEDEAMIRELIATFLSNLGYRVIQVENGRAAAERAREMGIANIHLLITDLVMPVMGGLELAAELRLQHAGLRVLFISGYTDDVVILEGEARNKTAFLRKPFRFDMLKQQIETLLAA